MGISETRKQILQILADGQFHSGTKLANSLGVSRSGIWKQLRALSEIGLECVAVSGKGYRLVHPIELLDKQKIDSALTAEAKSYISELILFNQIDSTNSFLMSAHDYDSGTVCLAEHQTGGKGRRGRDWISPFGSNIYMSILWRFTNGPSAISALSLAMGVAVVRALSRINIQDVGLKWPNDIFWQGKKLGGILVEVSGESDGPCKAVVGLGLNLFLPETAAVNITQEWVDLKQIMPGSLISRNYLTSLLINELFQVLATYETASINTYLNEWRSYDCLKGKPATLYIGERQYQGVVEGVDDQGLLLLKDAAGSIKAYASGEVSFSGNS